MNKLAVLALSLLLFFGAMLWYLADNSLNDFIKSQVIIQGDYYTQQQTQIADVTFTQGTGIGVLHQLRLSNNDVEQPNILSIDAAKVTFDRKSLNSDLIVIKKIEINQVTVWQKFMSAQNGSTNKLITDNLTQLKHTIAEQLVDIIPEEKPSLPKPSYVKDDGKKSNRGTIKTQIIIENIFVENLQVNIEDNTQSYMQTNIQSDIQDNVQSDNQYNIQKENKFKTLQFTSVRINNITDTKGNKNIISEQLAAILLDKLITKTHDLLNEKALENK